jgi:formyltetrahydrofolate synthetase
LVEEVAVGEVFEEGGEGAVELGEEVLAQAGEV